MAEGSTGTSTAVGDAESGSAEAGDPEGEPRPHLGGWWQRGWWQRGLTALPAAVLVVGAWENRWYAEDSFIFLRVVDQVTAGAGPVFNDGERVEVYTSAVWQLMLVVVDVLLGWLVPLPWLGLLMGLALGAASIVIAQRAAARLWRPGGAGGPDELFVPFGVIVPVSMAVVWDFVASGFETSLALAWSAACWWILVSLLDRPSSRARWWELVVLGLGPLVRPDFGLVSLVALAALLYLVPAGRRLRSLAVALAVPVAYQVFRMGYFGVLVPNTGIAKEGGQSAWGRGLEYVGDTVSTYVLWVPAGLLLGMLVVLFPWWQGFDRRRLVAMFAPVAAGLLHLLWVVRVGGDYMHARFVILSLVSLALPVAAVPWRRDAVRPLVGVMVAWGLLVAVTVRYEPAGRFPEVWIQDSKEFDRENGDHAVTISDLRGTLRVKAGSSLRDLAEKGGDAVVFNFFDQAVLPEGAGVTQVNRHIGLLGYAAGPDVRFRDTLGLGDPVAARLELGSGFDVPGHEKEISREWALALSTDPDWPLLTPNGTPYPHDAPALAAARRALACGDLAELRRATGDPLTPGRFLQNLIGSPARTMLRVPGDPFEAERRFCGG